MRARIDNKKTMRYFMKKYILTLFIMVSSFSAYAENEQDKTPLETCKEMAVEQEIKSENMKEYIDECVKYNAEDETVEGKE